MSTSPNASRYSLRVLSAIRGRYDTAAEVIFRRANADATISLNYIHKFLVFRFKITEKLTLNQIVLTLILLRSRYEDTLRHKLIIQDLNEHSDSIISNFSIYGMDFYIILANFAPRKSILPKFYSK